MQDPETAAALWSAFLEGIANVALLIVPLAIYYTVDAINGRIKAARARRHMPASIDSPERRARAKNRRRRAIASTPYWNL